MTKTLGTLMTLLVAGCGGAEAETPRSTTPRDHSIAADEWTGRAGTETAPTAREQRVIDDLARAAERVRGLEFRVPVEVAVQDQRAIIRYLTSELDEEDLETSREVYLGLGLIAEDLDIRDLLERVLGEQVVGYYDPEGDRFVIRDDIMRGLGRGDRSVDETRVTIVHELVHALQDQHLELGERFEEEDRDTDADGAYRAVVEGDATLAMIGYAAEEAGGRLEQLTQHPERLEQMMAGGMPVTDEELGNAPPIVRVTLMSAYLDGLVFTARLHGLGGFAAIDDAHRRPPVSTEQILHPEKFLRGELPDVFTVPELSELETAGYTQIEEDTLGELEMKVYLGQLEHDGVLPVAAEGWSGDRLRVYRAPGEALPACVWFTSWDDEAEARQAEDAAQRIMNAVPTGSRDTHRVERRGRALLIVRNLSPRLHGPVVRSFGAVASALPASPPRAAPTP